jgi:predicted nucleic acid-binding protein
MRRALLDTNLYIDWMNAGEREAIILGASLVRHLSTVVLMELEAGCTTLAARRAVQDLSRAFARVGRVVPPSRAAWASAGLVLRQLRSSGREIRRSSLVNDTLIALTARDLGATVFTKDSSDFTAIRRVVDFSLSVV